MRLFCSPLQVLTPRIQIRNYVRRRANLNASVSDISRHPALTTILYEPSVIIERQLEIGSVIAGYEQSRVFYVYKPDGSPVGELLEIDKSPGIGSGALGFLTRQLARRRRPFTVGMFDAPGLDTNPANMGPTGPTGPTGSMGPMNWRDTMGISLKRPFKFINSHVRSELPDGSLLGESQQTWHLFRRKYELFKASKNGTQMNQFGEIDAPFLSFQFPVFNAKGDEIARIDRRWGGIGREMFTDTGCYELQFGNLGFRERSVLLAATISIDFDYFTRLRHTVDDPVM